MTDSLKNLPQARRDQLVEVLLRLRSNLADGKFLREHLYTVDESRLAGNTHHYWIRWSLTPTPQVVFDRLISSVKFGQFAEWLKAELDRKIFQQLPREYSTLIKVPFSVGIGEIAKAREKRTASIVKNRLPAIMPYAIFHVEINRLLKLIGNRVQSPAEAEFDMLLAHYGKNAIAKARNRFPEVWDELRGHYVLDSRGSHFAKKLVTELKSRNLLIASSNFADIGSGVGTNAFAVNHYTEAHATGIELHSGLVRISKVTERRLMRLGQLDSKRLNFVEGDAFDSQVVDLGQYDIFYVYSPLGKWTIDIDEIVDRAKIGAVVIFNRLPIRNREIVEPLKNVAGLFAFRKIANQKETGSAATR